MAAVKVNRRAAAALAQGHVWVRASDVADRGGAAPGDAVQVVGPDSRLLGTAHYSSTSEITLRLLSRRAVAVNRDFWRGRLATAISYRQRVVSGSEAYRLVHAEGDRLPALIVDRYGDYLSIQTLSQGMERAKDDLVACLEELLAPRGIVERNDVPRRQKESLPLVAGLLRGELPGRVTYRMNGLTFEADLLGGQKTGAFLDQRENYLAAARWAHGRALDCFTSTGGFALHLAARCASVEGVDSSESALALARRNRDLNAIGNVEFRRADVFELLTGYAVAGRRFSTIVLDPPAFAKSRAALKGALQAYRQINYRALELLEPGGVLVSCSCSFHVSEAALAELIQAAAAELGKTLRLLERRGQALDHPVLAGVPETHYLKCLIFEAVPDD
jgi:23S rRNA (cytosine1962-C5)-methyltransferase